MSFFKIFLSFMIVLQILLLPLYFICLNYGTKVRNITDIAMIKASSITDN